MVGFEGYLDVTAALNSHVPKITSFGRTSEFQIYLVQQCTLMESCKQLIESEIAWQWRSRMFLSLGRKCSWTRTLEFHHLNCPTFSFYFVCIVTLEIISEKGSCFRRSAPLMHKGCHMRFACEKFHVKSFKRATLGRRQIQLI